MSKSLVEVQSVAKPTTLGRGTLQRKCACGTHSAGGEECVECAKKKKNLQRKAFNQSGSPELPLIVHEVMNSPGRPLDETTRALMEPRFGHDFSGVRIHTDSAAARSAEAVSAHAYTIENDVVFNRGEYRPGSAQGLRLLAHELAHVVQQSRGGVPPGIDGDPVLENAADRAASDAVSESTVVSVRGASGVGIARDAKPGKPPEEKLYEVKFPDGVRRLTAAEFELQKQEAIRRLRNRLKLVGDLADVGRNSQIDMLKEYHGGVESLTDVLRKPKALIGIAADIKAGVTPPYIGMWSHAKNTAQQGVAALDRGDLAAGARLLQLADSHYRDSMREWNAYREATIGGAERVASDLETVRDVSFAIALVAGAIVAAPVIATAVGVGGLGLTGAAATGLTAVGTAGTTGALGVGLGGGSTALASYASTGKVDVKATSQDAAKFGKQGFVTGLTAGFGSALGASGKAAQLAKPFAQQALKRCLTDAGINVAGEVTTAALDKVLPSEPQGALEAGKAEPSPKALLPGPARAALTGCITGALGVPVGKLGSGATRKGADLAVGAGVGYADARLSGQDNSAALAAAAQSTVTSSLIQHAQPHSPAAAKKKEKPATPAHETPAKTTEPPAKSAAAGSDESAKTPVAEKVAQQTKALAKEDVAPAILKDDAIAKKPTADGHEAVVTKQGVAKCSPTPCPVIHVEYAKELASNPELRAENKRVQGLRKTDPAQAAESADRLIRKLEAVRTAAGVETPAFASTSQRARLEEAVYAATQLGGKLKQDQLNAYLRKAKTPAQLEAIIRKFEISIENKREVAVSLAKTESLGGPLEGTDATGTTTKPRTRETTHEKALGADMERSRGAVPLAHDRHHIAPKKGGGKLGDEIRSLLEQASVHIDDEANGAPLRGNPRDPRAVHEADSQHWNVHTKENLEALRRELETVRGDTEATRDVLRKHGQRLIEGRKLVDDEFYLGP